MTRPCILAIAMLAVSAALKPTDGAITLPTDGTWTSFDWFEAPHDLNDFVDPLTFAGQLVQVGSNLDFLVGPFTYSSTSTLLLDVVDVFENGDRFSIFLDGNSLLGQTTVPANDGISVGNDIDAALADARWSRGTFPLPSGTHQLFIKTTEVPFSPPAVPQQLKEGKGWMRASAGPSVPEPATIVHWAFLTFAFGFTFSILQKKKKSGSSGT